MFCIKCGLELAEGQEICPACNTKVYHPDFPVGNASPTYPKKEFASEEFNPRGLMFVLTIIFGLACLLPMLFEISWHRTVTWSGIVSGAILLAYLCLLFPYWFKKPNPVIFFPTSTAAILGYLLYINLSTDGKWFLSFAFPVAGALGIIITATVALVRYIRRGKLYIFGGFLIALGGWTILIEFFIYLTFGFKSVVDWSVCSCATLFVIGMALIVIAIIKPLKESLRKIFYIG